MPSTTPRFPARMAGFTLLAIAATCGLCSCSPAEQALVKLPFQTIAAATQWSGGQTPRAEEFFPSNPLAFGPLDVEYAVQPRPPPHLAMVLFVRPSADNPGLRVILHDREGRFLVESRASSYSAVLVYPGDHTFIAYSDNDAGVRALVQAGRVYYVEIALSPGGQLPRAELVALHPGSPGWEDARTWVRGATQSKAERRHGQAALDARVQEVASRTQRVTEELSREEGDALRRHLLLTSDGE